MNNLAALLNLDTADIVPPPIQPNAPTQEPRAAIQPYALWSPSQIMEYTADPSACLLGDGFVERAEWTSLIGIGGLGKTRLALWLSVAQITGREWCGLPTRGDPQKYVFFSTENGVRRWKHDLGCIFATLTDDERALVESNLRIQALTPDDDGDLCLGNLETISRLNVTLALAEPGVVIFDPFADMVDGDENKTVDVVATLRALRSVTRKSCPDAAVIIIHHARSGAANVAQAGDNFNAGNFGRGAKALYSRVRCELQLAPQHRDDPNKLVLACGKANNTAKFAPRGILFDPEAFTYSVDEAFDLDAWRNDVAGKRNGAAVVTIADVVDVVRENSTHPGDEVSMKTIVANLGDSGAEPRTIKKWVKKAVDAGYLRDGKKRSLYRLGAKPLPK